jgi:hypothetical protein
MALAQAFAAAASAAAGIGNVVPAADPASLSQQEIEHMDALEVENSGEIEMNGIMYAVRRMAAHWEQLCAARSADELVLSESREQDTALYSSFRARFASMDVALVREDTLKDVRMHETWRDFLTALEHISEHNMISLLRKDAALGYNDENTMLVPRAQFLCVEIARNREGINDCAQLRSDVMLEELTERKCELTDARADSVAVARQVRVAEFVAVASGCTPAIPIESAGTTLTHAPLP